MVFELEASIIYHTSGVSNKPTKTQEVMFWWMLKHYMYFLKKLEYCRKPKMLLIWPLNNMFYSCYDEKIYEFQN